MIETSKLFGLKPDIPSFFWSKKEKSVAYFLGNVPSKIQPLASQRGGNVFRRLTGQWSTQAKLRHCAECCLAWVVTVALLTILCMTLHVLSSLRVNRMLSVPLIPLVRFMFTVPLMLTDHLVCARYAACAFAVVCSPYNAGALHATCASYAVCTMYAVCVLCAICAVYAACDVCVLYAVHAERAACVLYVVHVVCFVWVLYAVRATCAVCVLYAVCWMWCVCAVCCMCRTCCICCLTTSSRWS